jgi:3alpha(or 20beta)-hydroxysteroid dehydrogenase
MFELDGKVAVITGGASGIGHATATRFAQAGALVVVADITDASAVAEECGGIYVRADVSREHDVAELYRAAALPRGGIDVCVNSAGITVDEVSIGETSPESMRRAFDVNTVGVFLGLKHAPRYMRDGGSIINVASLAAVSSLPGYGAYAASKAAAVSLTQTGALELGPLGIRVNAICPASVDTPMLRSQEHGEIEAAIVRQAAPLGLIAQPEHVAALIHFLAADDCPLLTGQAINLDGGLTAGTSTGTIEAIAASVA